MIISFFTCLSFPCPPTPILIGWRQIVESEAHHEFSSSSPVLVKPQLINQLDSTLLFRFKTEVKFSKSQPGSSILCLLFTNLASGIWHHHFTSFHTFPPLIFLYTPCAKDMNFMTTSWYFSMLWGPFSLHLCIPKAFPSSHSVFPIIFMFSFIELLFNWITLRSHYVHSPKCFLFYSQLFNQALLSSLECCVFFLSLQRLFGGATDISFCGKIFSKVARAGCNSFNYLYTHAVNAFSLV